MESRLRGLRTTLSEHSAGLCREVASLRDLEFAIILSTVEASSAQEFASSAYTAAFRLRSRRARSIFSAVKSVATTAPATISHRMVNRRRGSLMAGASC